MSEVKKNKIVIYTAITNNYDILRNPSYISKDCDYVCFTDSANIDSNLWKIEKISNLQYDHNRNAKQYKILPHLFLKECEYSIWIDGNVDIVDDVRELVEEYLAVQSLALLKHPTRNCIYDELQACLRLRKDDPKIMRNQIEKYRSLGYPKNNGLMGATVIFRRHNDPKVISLMEDWWKEIMLHSKRDQLSFGYVAWKNQMDYAIMDVHFKNKTYFKRVRHRQ